jgi:hypothetical protein
VFFPVFGFHSTSFFLFLGAQRTPPCARLESDCPSFISLRVGLSNQTKPFPVCSSLTNGKSLLYISNQANWLCNLDPMTGATLFHRIV